MDIEALVKRRLALEKSLRELEGNEHELDARSNKILSNMKEIANESLRVADLAHNAPKILDDLDAEFEKRTGLNSLDITFLFFAIALQCARIYMLPGFNTRPDHKETSKQVDNTIKKLRIVPKDWRDILTDKVPYDTIAGSAQLGLGLNPSNHREKTIGHDPLLGWVFGTANILTDTITLNNFRSFHVASGRITSNQVPVWDVIMCLPKTLINENLEKKASVGLALLTEGVHLWSDVGSTKSLPLPIINTVSFEFGHEIAKYGFDMANLITVGKQASIAIMINMIIASVHRLFYDMTSGMSHRQYEVKTRKILSYSNLIATASNIIYVAVRSYLGDASAIRKLDIGGMLVTIWRLITDIEFINQVKREFIMESFNEMIRGMEYSFE